jgi:NAD(P)-dependent dehydrogenase (short-subunit alcohol dehydrogenase family)
MTAPLSGRVALVTGASTGLGRALAVGLAQRGAHIVAAVEDDDPAVAKQTLRRLSGSDAIEALGVDRLSQPSVSALAERLRDRHDRLDLLVNVGGAVAAQHALTADGVERTLAGCYLSAFHLTTLLLEPLAEAAPSRVVNVVSRVHRGGHVDLDDLHGEHDYSPARAYAQAQLAMVLFTYELACRLDGLDITVNCVEPGLSAPARTVLKVATDPELEDVTAECFDRWGQQRRTSDASYDPGTAAGLWRASEDLIRVPMPV